MAVRQAVGVYAPRKHVKKSRQGLGKGTKFSNNVGSKRFKKKYRGQGKFR